MYGRLLYRSYATVKEQPHIIIRLKLDVIDTALKKDEKGCFKMETEMYCTYTVRVQCIIDATLVCQGNRRAPNLNLSPPSSTRCPVFVCNISLLKYILI